MSINLRNRRVPLRASRALRGSRSNGRRTPSPTPSTSSVVELAQRLDNHLSVKSRSTLCEKYSGSASTTKVDAWLDLFELVTLGSSDKERLIALGRHVSGEVINWLARDVLPLHETITWAECKKKMIQRFGRVIVNPLVEASKRTLSIKENVLMYYNDKRRLLDLSGTSEANQVALLTEGMPETYRIQLASATPNTTEKWLEIALAIEEAKSSRFKKSFTANSSTQRPEGANSQQRSFVAREGGANRKNGRYNRKSNDTPPREPCRYCQEAGQTEYHWHRQCPRRNKSNEDVATTTSAPAVNAISNGYVTYNVNINGVNVRMLLDTGSTLSAISSSTAKRLRLKPDRNSSIPITQVDGVTSTAGSVRVNAAIQSQKKRLTLHILPNLEQDGLLGLDAAHAFALRLDFSRPTKPQTSPKRVYHVSPQSLTQVLDSYNVFAKHDKDVGRIRDFEHVIRLKPGSQPINQRPFRMSPQRTAELRKHTDAMLAQGMIRHSCSPYASPMFLVPKSDGSLRPVIDYRKINAQTISERQPLPIIRDLIDRLSGSAVFTKLDVAWGYWHVRLHPDSVEVTSFVTPYAQYEFVVLPMGLKNASSVFQRELLRTLKEFVGKGVEQYVDDTILHTPDESSHLELLRRVLEALARNGIRLRRSKCRFMVREVEFLGMIISAGSVQPSQSKIKAVTDFPIPRDVLTVQRFVGLANHYRDFVPNFSEKAKPLTMLTRKGTAFVWGDAQQQAFENLRNELSTFPVLGIYDESLPTILQTDASGVGLGAILMQRTRENALRVISYWSRKLTETESRYSAPELECYAVVLAVEHFHVYLDGIHFDIYSDCAALRWLFEIKNPKSRLFRWSIRLGSYDYTVQYRPGVTNQAADALSRHPVVLHIIADDLLAKQYEIKPDVIRNPIVINGVTHVRYNGRTRIVVPPSLVNSVLESAHIDNNHPGIAKTTRIISSQYWWPSRDDDITKFVRTCHVCQTVKSPNTPRLGGSNPIPTPEQPNEVWAMDTIVMGRVAESTSKKYVITIVDHHSRYVWASAVKNNTAEAAINALSRVLESVGKPRAILTDNGTNFVSKRFRNYLGSSTIRHLLTPIYRPQANGTCEKMNDAIMRGIRLALAECGHKRWWAVLPSVVTAINDQPHSITGFSPRYVHFGLVSLGHAKPDVSVEDARKTTVEKSRFAQISRKQTLEASHPPSNYEIGDYVKYRIPDNHPSKNKLSSVFVAPCRISQKLGDESYRIDHLDSDRETIIRTFVTHSSALLPYYMRESVLLLRKTLIHDKRQLLRDDIYVRFERHNVNITFNNITKMCDKTPTGSMSNEEWERNDEVMECPSLDDPEYAAEYWASYAMSDAFEETDEECLAFRARIDDSQGSTDTSYDFGFDRPELYLETGLGGPALDRIIGCDEKSNPRAKIVVKYATDKSLSRNRDRKNADSKNFCDLVRRANNDAIQLPFVSLETRSHYAFVFLESAWDADKWFDFFGTETAEWALRDDRIVNAWKYEQYFVDRIEKDGEKWYREVVVTLKTDGTREESFPSGEMWRKVARVSHEYDVSLDRAIID